MKLALRMDIINRVRDRAYRSRSASQVTYEHRYIATLLDTIFGTGVIDTKSTTLEWDEDAVLRLAEQIRSERAARMHSAIEAGDV